jgi:hypothetical protein
MKTLSIFFACALIAASTALAQRGDITIPTGADITVPTKAQLCADRYYANNPGYGTLSYGNDSRRICGAVIPVEFLSLSAYHLNGSVTVLWRTVSESNCAGYEVQRSLDQALWQTAGYVSGHGTNAEEVSYSFEDALPTDIATVRTLFYRLRQLDYDGTFAYSPVVEVSIGGAPRTLALHAAYPNPASDRIAVRYTLPDAGSARIAVYAMTGQEVMSFGGGEFSGAGEHLLSVNTSTLAPGGYLIELLTGDTRLVRRFVVRR